MGRGAGKQFLLTDGAGQVGCSLRSVSPAHWRICAPAHGEMRRPANSCLSTLKPQQDYGIVPRPWRSAVFDVVKALQPPMQPKAPLVETQ